MGSPTSLWRSRGVGGRRGEAQQGVGGIYIYQIYIYISAITIYTHTHTHTHTHTYVWFVLLYNRNQLPSWASQVAQRGKNSPAMQEAQETWVWSLNQENPLEEVLAIHSSILAWRIRWREESDKLQSVGSQRVRQDWATKCAQQKSTQHRKAIILEFKREREPAILTEARSLTV